MSANTLYLRSAGENSLVVYLGEDGNPEVNARVQAAASALKTALADVIIDLVPSYASILVIHRAPPDAAGISYGDIARRIRAALQTLSTQSESPSHCVTLPVYYAPEVGDDLARLAENAGLSIDGVIALHSARPYRVYAIGFAPGFAYLGEVNPQLRAPRLATPRQAIPKGAVAIADRQTAVYPARSPGGWNIIGRCPVELFDPGAEPPMPFAVGDQVQFEPVTRERFLALGGELE